MIVVVIVEGNFFCSGETTFTFPSFLPRPETGSTFFCWFGFIRQSLPRTTSRDSTFSARPFTCSDIRPLAHTFFPSGLDSVHFIFASLTSAWHSCSSSLFTAIVQPSTFLPRRQMRTSPVAKLILAPRNDNPGSPIMSSLVRPSTTTQRSFSALEPNTTGNQTIPTACNQLLLAFRPSDRS